MVLAGVVDRVLRDLDRDVLIRQHRLTGQARGRRQAPGAIEQVDSLKSAFDGAAETGLNVFDSSFDDALATPGMAARQIGAEALCQQCRDCALATTCGGGYYPHRYRAGSGFLNPSVYCADLYKLISHIKDRVETALAARSRS